LRLINQTKVGLHGGEDGAVAASAAAGCVCVGRELGVSVQTVRCHRVSPAQQCMGSLTCVILPLTRRITVVATRDVGLGCKLAALIRIFSAFFSGES